MSDLLLVTGASGHLGQRVLHHLTNTLQVPARRIVAASRDISKLAAWAERGVLLRKLDFEQPLTFASALEGVTRVLLISTDAVDRPGRRLAQHRAAVAAFAQAGVQHVVYTSMPQPEGSPVLLAPDHVGTEAALADSTLPGWTVLRNHWYFESLFYSLPPALASGQWYSATGEGRAADISRDDLARAAATVLAGTATGRHTYTLSGEQAWTTAEVAQLASDVLGKPIQVVQVPVEALVQGMMSAGVPEPVACLLASFDANTAAGRVAQVTEDYRRITGVAPQTLAQWLRAHRSVFTGAG